MNALIYELTLEQPLLVTTLEGDPNSSRSADYLTGSQMRGLLIHRLRATPHAPADLLSDPDAQRRFFDGTVRYLHAYPIAADRRALPAPLSLYTPKAATNGTTLNAAIPAGAEQLAARRGAHERWEPLSARLLVQPDPTSLRSVAPLHTVAIHIQRDRVYGRARRENGEVFRYDALAAGLRLRGAILYADDADGAFLHDLLMAEPIAWFGRSRSAGYGQVRITRAELVAGWRETPGERSAPPGAFTLTLLSHAILRDTAGRELVAPDAAALSAALRVPVELDAAQSFTATTIVSSYNTTAQLPTVQRHALRAGSVLRLIPQRPLTLNDIARWEAQGIGERRAEGFGRVACDWLPEPAYTLVREEPVAPANADAASAPTALSPAGTRIAALMAERLWAAQIDAAIGLYVRAQVADQPALLDRMPANSQLGRVRVLIRRALPTADVASVRAGIETMRQAGQEQFDRARIDGRTLSIWMRDLLQPADDPPQAPVWRVLEPYLTAPSTVAGVAAPANQRLAQLTALRVIDAVLAATSRLRRREVQA